MEAANRIGVEVRLGWRQGCLQSQPRLNQTPLGSDFNSPESLFAVFAHELIHSTGHKSRLNRTFGERFGDPTTLRKNW